MTGQSGGGGVPSGVAGGALTGTYPSPTLAVGQVPAELGYVQATANFTGAGSGADVAVTGMTLTVMVGTRALMVTYFCPYALKGSLLGAILVKLHDDTAGAFVETAQFDLAAATGTCAVLQARLNPAVGSRSYSVYAQYLGGGTAATLFGAATFPMWFQVREI